MGVTQVDPQPKSYGGLSNFPEDPPPNEVPDVRCSRFGVICPGPIDRANGNPSIAVEPK